jgi:DNA polymerase-3 subunit delta
LKLAAAQARRFLATLDRTNRAALVYGPNRAFVSEAAEAIAKSALDGSDDPFASTRLVEADLKSDKARLWDALTQQSLLGGPTLVRVRAEGETAADALLHALGEIEAGAPSGFLLVEGGELNSKGKIVAGFENAKRAVAMAFYEETEAERAAFVRGLLDSSRVPMSADAKEAFLAAAPSDRALARSEAEKLFLFAHELGRPIEPEDVAALSAFEQESALDEAALAALSGQAGQAMEALERIEALSGVMAVKALERRVLRLLEARVMVETNVASAAEAGDRLKPKVFWKERDIFAGQVRRWSTAQLQEALSLLWAAELRAKTAKAPQEVIAGGVYRGVAEIIKG